MLKPLALLPLFLALTACPDRATIASASVLPAYQVAAQAVLARNAAHPYTEAQKAAIRAADDAAFAKVVAINGAEMRKAEALHWLIREM